jgi:hypothetical protein
VALVATTLAGLHSIHRKVHALEGSLSLLEGHAVPGTVTANMCTRQDIIVVPMLMLPVD